MSKIIDDKNGVYATYKEIKFKTLMLKSSLYDYRDACIHTC